MITSKIHQTEPQLSLLSIVLTDIGRFLKVERGVIVLVVAKTIPLSVFLILPWFEIIMTQEQVVVFGVINHFHTHGLKHEISVDFGCY